MKINLISEWGNVVSNVRNNIVFENRNRAYGAYFIRREYPRTMFLSLFITATVIGFGIMSVKLSHYFNKKVVELITPFDPFQLPVEIPFVEIPANPPAPSDPVKSTPPPKGSEFMAPVVSDDTDKIDDRQLTQDDVKPGKTDGVDTFVVDMPETPKKTGTGVVNTDTVETVLEFVDVNPSFPGGIEKMYDFITSKIKYPQTEKEIGISGTVYIGFVVDKSGKIKDVTIEKGIPGGTNLGKEAQRVIGIMPDWNPGIYKGQTVSVRYHMPVRFVLQ